jgi:YVTN family beta-propeller protein
MQELREWYGAEPTPAPSQLAKALGRLDAAIACEADKHRPVALGNRAIPPSRRRWPGWVAPLASAAALIAVIAGTFAVVSAVGGARPGRSQLAASSYPHLVCVLSQGGIITRIRDGRALAPIHVTASSYAIAVTPDGKTAYVAAPRGERRPGVVIPIQLATGEVLKPIPVGVWPNAISITANGKTAYVTNFLSGTVTPIATATNTALAPIKVGSRPDEVVTAPDGRTLYVSRNEALTPVRTATGTRLRPLPIPGMGLAPPSHGIVVTPDSKTVYVLASGGVLRDLPGTVTPIQRDHALTPIVVPPAPDSITLASGGRTAYVVSHLSPRAGSRHQYPRDTITPINLSNGTTLRALAVRASSNGWGNVVIAPDGKTAYFLDTLRGGVTPIDLATLTAGKLIPSGGASYTMLFGQGAAIGYLIESNQVVPLNTATNTTLPPIKMPATVIDWGQAVRR